MALTSADMYVSQAHTPSRAHVCFVLNLICVNILPIFNVSMIYLTFTHKYEKNLNLNMSLTTTYLLNAAQTDSIRDEDDEWNMIIK